MSQSKFETIKFNVNNGLAEIILNRPDAANGIDLQLSEELMRAAITCDEDSSIRAVLISGEGKMFCAGGDLKSFAKEGDQLSSVIKLITTYIHAAVSRFSRMSAPVVIAVNGTAAGGGMSLALCGDIVLAAESAKFTMAYTAAGLSPDVSGSYTLPRLVGLRRAQELIFTNRRLNAEEAQEWGLITRTVADDRLMTEARELAEGLAQGATESYGVVKSLLLSSYQQSIEGQMEQEARGISAMSAGRDGKEGIDAFLNKRKPEYTGNV